MRPLSKYIDAPPVPNRTRSEPFSFARRVLDSNCDVNLADQQALKIDLAQAVHQNTYKYVATLTGKPRASQAQNRLCSRGQAQIQNLRSVRLLALAVAFSSRRGALVSHPGARGMRSARGARRSLRLRHLLAAITTGFRR